MEIFFKFFTITEFDMAKNRRHDKEGDSIANYDEDGELESAVGGGTKNTVNGPEEVSAEELEREFYGSEEDLEDENG